MPLSAADRREISDIKQAVRGGRLNAGNPGFQAYGNAGGHGTTILPRAARNQSYYEYQIGGAVAPAGGFAAGAGAAGVRRLVMLVSPVSTNHIRQLCHVLPGPAVPAGAPPAPPVAVNLPISAAYPSIMQLRNSAPHGAAISAVGAAGRPADDACAETFLAPAGNEEVRSITHTFPARAYPPASRLPAAGVTKKIYFKREIVVTYNIHASYFTDDHYRTFSAA